MLLSVLDGHSGSRSLRADLSCCSKQVSDDDVRLARLDHLGLVQQDMVQRVGTSKQHCPMREGSISCEMPPQVRRIREAKPVQKVGESCGY